MKPHFPVHLLIDTPGGLLPLTPERSKLPLPRGPEAGEPIVTYGPYLNTLSEYLSKEDFKPLLLALERHLGKRTALESICGLDIISEKHGALYHVARIRAHLADKAVSLAANVALTGDQQRVLESESNLLNKLQLRSQRTIVPRAYLLDDAPSLGEMPSRIKILFTEWFDDFHEFHLSVIPGEDLPVIKVWMPRGEDILLNRGQTQSLYSEAAAILTDCLDELTFEQVYPWHHAAGDFIVKPAGEIPELRLITVRGYKPLIKVGSGGENLWVAIAHFFLNMTIRMRLDRLDGTGDLAWADSECLRGITSGFVEAWCRKRESNPDLPSCEDVLTVLLAFSPEELLSLAELVLHDGLVEEDEDQFIRQHLQAHIHQLIAALMSHPTVMGLS